MIDHITSLVLVVGCQRSGTTLTGQILGAHERAVLIDEFDGLYPWFTAMVKNAPDQDIKTAEVLEKSASKYRTPEKRFLHTESTIALAGSVDTLVLKAPNLTYSYRAISSLGIPVKVVYPVRDPRAVVASMMRKSQINFVDNQMLRLRETPEIATLFPDETRSIEDQSAPYWLRAAHVWKIKSGLMSHFQQIGHPVTQFRYEDLVQEPHHWIDDIAAFCGLTRSKMLFSHEHVYVGQGPGGTDRTRPVDRTSENTWSDTLDDQMAHDVLAQAQPLAGHLGYG